MTMTMGGSKNVTNSKKDAKIVGKKGYILYFSMESTDYEHYHDHDHGGSKMLQTLKKVLKWWGKRIYPQI